MGRKQKTERYISCLDCKEDWIDFCYVCKTSAWQIRHKKKDRFKIRLRNPTIKPEHNFICSKRVYGLINQGHKAQCVCCEAKSQLTFDHIHPLSKGGLDDNSNGQVLCLRCNWAKGNKIISIEELKKLIEI